MFVNTVMIIGSLDSDGMHPPTVVYCRIDVVGENYEELALARMQPSNLIRFFMLSISPNRLCSTRECVHHQGMSPKIQLVTGLQYS